MFIDVFVLFISFIVVYFLNNNIVISMIYMFILVMLQKNMELSIFLRCAGASSGYFSV